MAAMRKALVGMLLWLGLLSGCNAEPIYRGVSFVTYNYTPWNLEPVRISDASGRVASSSTLPSGGGEGSISCCYTFSGTEFEVKWSGGAPDLLRKHLFDGKFDEVLFKKETSVHFPATKVPEGDGTLILELHIYPDEHMELALSRELKGQVRIPIVDTARWLYGKCRDELVRYKSADHLTNDVAKVTKQAWMSYRLEDAKDLRAYMYLYFIVASDFDRDAQIAALLADPARTPGAFGIAVMSLSTERIAQLNAAGASRGEKNVRSGNGVGQLGSKECVRA